MENLCYWCKAEDKEVLARVTWQQRPCCAAHRMKFLQEGQTETARNPVPDGPGPPAETNPSDPILSQSHTPKGRKPGRLEKASMTAPVVEVYPAEHFEKAFDRAVNPKPSPSPAPPAKRRGRPPGVKRNSDIRPEVAPAVKEAQEKFAQRQENLALRTAIDRRTAQPNPVDLTRLYEIHADLIARRARIDTILAHLEGAIQALGNESGI